MLFPFSLELFPFPSSLVAHNYSHSHGNLMGIGIPIPMHTTTVCVGMLLGQCRALHTSIGGALNI